MLNIKFFKWILLLSLLIAPNLNAQDDTLGKKDDEALIRSIPLHADITELGINRFIALQTFPVLTGVIPGTGYNYHISITRPMVFIRTNFFQARFSIIITSDIGNYILPIAPNIYIPPLSISYNEINAFFVNFETLINQSPLPNSLKQIIIQGYNSQNLAVFPSRLLNSALKNIPNFLDISLNDIQFQFNALERKLRFTVTPQVSGNPPLLKAYWLKPAAYRLKLKFSSNIFTVARRIKIYDSAQREIADGGHYLEIPKGGESQELEFTNISTGIYYVHVIYNSIFGEYIRTYRFNYNTATYNTWFNTTITGGYN